MPHKDPEKRREWQRKWFQRWREANRESARAQVRKWHHENKDKKNLYRKKNRDKSREWERKYRVANREKMRLKNKRGQLRRLERRDLAAGRPKPEFCEFGCGRGPVVWDHDHSTNQFRSWPCKACNTVMGLVNDNPEVLRKMADVVEQHKRQYA